MKFIATLVSVCFFALALLVLVIAKTVSGTAYFVSATARLFSRQDKPAQVTEAAITGVEMTA